jgi:hypothetical protein
MNNINEIEKKFREIGFKTKSDRKSFSKDLNFDFEYKTPEGYCIHNTYMDDSTIANRKNDELCPTGTKS